MKRRRRTLVRPPAHPLAAIFARAGILRELHGLEITLHATPAGMPELLDELHAKADRLRLEALALAEVRL